MTSIHFTNVALLWGVDLIKEIPVLDSTASQFKSATVA